MNSFRDWFVEQFHTQPMQPPERRKLDEERDELRMRLAHLDRRAAEDDVTAGMWRAAACAWRARQTSGGGNG